MHAMIFTFGIHLEFASTEIDSSFFVGVVFADIASKTEVIRLLTEQVVVLIAKAFRM